MKLEIKLTRHTTASELAHLGQFITGLAFDRGAHLTPPADCEPTTGYAPVEDAADPTPAETVHVAGNEPPKRRRRTKAEIEAEKLAEENAAVAAAEAEAQASNEAALVAAGNDSPAPTPPAPQQDTPPSETASTAPASASPSEVPTVGSLNQRAGALVKKIGPEKIKARINELGGNSIAGLGDAQRIELGKWLAEQEASA
jgi:hypothetical protein